MAKAHSRRLLLDHWRGFAVLHMAFFHLSYDLMKFGFITIDLQDDFTWWIQPRIIVTFFMTAVGSSLVYAHRNPAGGIAIRWWAFWQRWLKIALGALFISIFTFFMFPEDWVYFGTLHSIATCSLLTLPFLPYPRTSLIAGVLVILPSIFGWWEWPWWELPHSSMDYIPPLPWLGFSLVGVFLAHNDFWGRATQTIPHSFFSPLKPLEFCGRHALKIYIAHQPILFGLVFSVAQLVK